MKVILAIFSFLYVSAGFAQQDTINQIDQDGLRQGHWVYYGKDRPEINYPPDGKIEEGKYVDNRKEGLWIKYYNDGATPKVKAEYQNNRPCGRFWKYNPDGTERDSGTFDRNNFNLIRVQGSVNQGTHSDSLHEVPLNNYKDTIVCHEKAPLLTPKIRGCVTRSVFKENGYNKVYNENDEIWQVGEFRNGRLWDGKVYVYESDGILVKVKIFKNGTYHSDGQY